MPSHICGDVIMNQWLNVFYLSVPNLWQYYKILMLVLLNRQMLSYNVQICHKYCPNIVQTNWGSVLPNSVSACIFRFGSKIRIPADSLPGRVELLIKWK